MSAYRTTPRWRTTGRGIRLSSTPSRPAAPRFAVCTDNAGYATSLERNKIYLVVPDKDAERNADVRVVDESGEDYLFSGDRFVVIDVLPRVRESVLKAR